MKPIIPTKNFIQNKFIEKQTDVITANVTENIKSALEGRLAGIEEENKNLKEKIKTMEEKIKQTEKEIRKKHLLIHGIAEEEHENLEDKIINLLKATNINIGTGSIDEIQRIGNINKQKRPILVKLVSMQTKKEILKRNRISKKLHITENYPKDVLELRKSLKAQMLEERQKGKYAYLSYDKLVIKESNKEQSNKRPLPISPIQNNQPINQEVRDPVAKVSKTDAFAVMRSKSYMNSKN